MTPEEWLRERGIDITRRPEAKRPGELASQHTHAMPSIPGEDDDDVESLTTRLVPTVVKLDLRLGGDVAEWPTAALPEPPASLNDGADSFLTDEDAAVDGFDDGFDYSLEEEMTVPLPIIVPSRVTPPPVALGDGAAEETSAPEAEASAEDDAASDISATPTRRLT